jgi:hypothetical protein
MLTRIPDVVAAVEALVLLLCNAGSFTHMAEHLRQHTETRVSFARANAERIQQQGGEDFAVSAVQ